LPDVTQKKQTITNCRPPACDMQLCFCSIAV